jgi:cytochrome c
MSTDPEGPNARRCCRCVPRQTALRLVVAVVMFVSASATARAFTQEQAHNGGRIYKRQCARCHGASGEGKDNQYKGLRAPELMGATALPCRPRAYQKIRHRDFRTAKDVYDFVSAAMPADQPAILDADEYWNVVAYLLQANGKPADDTRLDAASSAKIVLHPDCPSTASSGARQAQP